MAIPRTERVIRSVLFDLLIGGVIAMATGLNLIAGRHVGPLAGVGFAMALILIMRRWYPLAVMAAVGLLALLQVVLMPAAYDPLPFDVAVLIAMYSVVKYARRLRDAYLAAGVVAVGIGIEVARHFNHNWPFLIMVYLAVCGGVWSGGYTVRTRRMYVQSLEERNATLERERDHLARIAVADERAEIARELHDVVAHSLAVMIVQADGASYALSGDPEQARIAIKQVATTGRDALEDMRRLVGVLRGTTNAESDAGSADRRRIDLDRLETLVDGARSAGLHVDMRCTGERPGAIPAAVELTVYRLVQEALTNVLRHAGPSARVDLTLAYRPGSMGVRVIDDGGGRLGGTPEAPAGHGLIGMRERVAVHGGTFAAGPRLGGGWRIEAEVRWA